MCSMLMPPEHATLCRRVNDVISASPTLEAVHLARRHPDAQRWLLDGVSLEVRPGTIVAVTGVSGAGKTLLLRAMAMLDPVDAGEVRLRGDTFHREAVPEFRRQVIYLHQRPVLLGETVAETLGRPFFLAAHRQRRFDRDRVVAMFQAWGRDDAFLAARTADLSGGESQLVALARALQLEPTVLLLDEPTAALHAHAAEAVEQHLRQWLAESPHARAIVWVGHDAAQIVRIADRVFSMDAGCLAEEDHR